MNWFQRGRPGVEPSEERRSIGEGVFHRCVSCGATELREAWARGFEVCPRCDHHGRLHASRWVELLCDPDRFAPLGESVTSCDPLEFSDGRTYVERLRSARRSGLSEALVAGDAEVEGIAVTLGVFAFAFMGGSMGSVVGERLARVFERAAERRCPAVVVSASGGARMQEGILSLMQMAKSVAALGRLRDAGAPFVSILTDPTTGGVAASYALLGDINLAEPGALIGFAGPRVIEQTIRQKLPDGFQRSEFLLEHGMVDAVVPRGEMRATVARLLRLLTE
jgi:acetyl-CoA carboxylase carboxyl transferase subunit beta